MTTLIWDTATAPHYETGVEKGVFYPSDGPGVVWNGLQSVVEKLAGGEQASFAIDGVTQLNTVGSRYYQAIVSALSAPREFSPYVGDLEVIPGFILTRQPRMQFGFSYKTLIADIGYKLHIVYNVTATVTSRSYASTNDTADAVPLEWQFDSIPETTPGYRPTCHFSIDSTKIDAITLSAVEDILYGTETVDPAMPVLTDMMTLINPPPDDGS